MNEVKLLKMTFVIYVKMMLLLDTNHTNQNWHSCQLLYDKVMILTMLNNQKFNLLHITYTSTLKSECKEVIGARKF